MEGKLKNWNTDRGFGFIAPSDGGADVFVHIKALPRDGSRPMVGEVLLFDVDTDREGRKRAVNVRRPGQKATATRVTTPTRAGKSGRGWLGAAMPSVIVIALAAYGYQQYQGYSARPDVDADPDALLGEATPAVNSASFKCDGRTQCSQMTSCAEAEYFLKNCPGVEMDGNNDGEPCEQQWCQ